MSNTVGNTGFITEMDIRRVMRDFPEGNNLLDDYEFTQEELRTAMTLVVDEWNDMTPSIRYYTLESFPFRSIMLRGAVAYLLQMASISFARNHLSYTAGGGSVDDQNKAGLYGKLSEALMVRVLSDMRGKKNELNFEDCWGVC